MRALPLKPFRFGFQAYNADSLVDWKAKARKAETLGFASFLLADHYIGPGPALAATGHPVQNIAAVPAMAVAAEATTSIKVGCRVMCVDYRNPVVLAKEMATIDLFSEGRLELGLGAGWLTGEYEAMGVTMDSPVVRIRRLADVVRVVKAAMADGEVAVEGAAGVRAIGFEGVPKPVQRPHPPIMIGGGGRRVLQLAGREADIVSINFNNASGTLGPHSFAGATAAKTAEKVGWITEAANGRDIEIEIGGYLTIVTDEAAGTAAAIGARFAMEPADVLAHPHALIGSVDAICDELQRRRESYGISYVTVGEAVADAFAPVVERLTGT
ncbi:MAG TPA: TIGR03621 family F420-dependent LLM class oxidoreductase [Acidimicrobiales bacterium]